VKASTEVIGSVLNNIEELSKGIDSLGGEVRVGELQKIIQRYVLDSGLMEGQDLGGGFCTYMHII